MLTMLMSMLPTSYAVAMMCKQKSDTAVLSGIIKGPFWLRSYGAGSIVQLSSGARTPTLHLTSNVSPSADFVFSELDEMVLVCAAIQEARHYLL